MQYGFMYYGDSFMNDEPLLVGPFDSEEDAARNAASVGGTVTAIVTPTEFVNMLTRDAAAEREEALAGDLYCDECGMLMQVDVHEVTNHIDSDGGIDYGADCDHVALNSHLA